MTRTLTPDQLRRFGSDGYLVLPDLVSPQDTRRLREGAEKLLAELVDEARSGADDRLTWWRLASGQPYVLKAKPVTDRLLAAAELASSPPVTGLVAELLDAPPSLMEDKIMYKQVVADTRLPVADRPVLGADVRKHTDADYFTRRGYPRVLTVAVCLDPCTETAGAPRVWPGTHRRAIHPVDTDRQGPVVPDEEAPDADAVALTADAGSVLLWDAALVHASAPNTSGRPRRLLVLGYAPERPVR